MSKRIYVKDDLYTTMFIQHKGKCKICGNEGNTKRKRSLVVDHCHKTNRIRGLLCQQCNAAIGLLKENISVMYNVINYLENRL